MPSSGDEPINIDIDTERLDAARESARLRHSLLSSEAFDEVCGDALAHAEETARDPRELIAIFEAEVDRRIEEQSVLGAAGSVLPGAGAEAETPSWLTGAAADRAQAERTTRAAEPVVTPEPAVAAAQQLTTGEDYAHAAAALRLEHGLDPALIAERLGVPRDYCVRCLLWFLGRAESKLDPPSHVDRAQMRAFAAGVTSTEQNFAIHYHASACADCAAHLADLLEHAVGMLDPHGATRNGVDVAPWMGSAPARRIGSEVPFMTLKAEALRRYMRPRGAAARVAEPEAVLASARPARDGAPGPLVSLVRRERRALAERLAAITQGGGTRRGYATAVLTMIAGLTAIESGAAVTGVGSPVLSAVDDLGAQQYADTSAAERGDRAERSGGEERAAAPDPDDDVLPPPPPPRPEGPAGGEAAAAAGSHRSERAAERAADAESRTSTAEAEAGVAAAERRPRAIAAVESPPPVDVRPGGDSAPEVDALAGVPTEAPVPPPPEQLVDPVPDLGAPSDPAPTVEPAEMASRDDEPAAEFEPAQAAARHDDEAGAEFEPAVVRPGARGLGSEPAPAPAAPAAPAEGDQAPPAAAAPSDQTPLADTPAPPAESPQPPTVQPDDATPAPPAAPAEPAPSDQAPPADAPAEPAEGDQAPPADTPAPPAEPAQPPAVQPEDAAPAPAAPAAPAAAAPDQAQPKPQPPTVQAAVAAQPAPVAEAGVGAVSDDASD